MNPSCRDRDEDGCTRIRLVITVYVVVTDSVAAGISSASIMSMRQAIGVAVDVAKFVVVAGIVYVVILVEFVIVAGILYVAMLADEEFMRSDVVMSALVAPKSFVALHLVVGGGDANCMEMVLNIDVASALW